MARTKHGLPGIYNATPLTLADQEGAALALDSQGNARISMATSVAGEDIAADVLKVEERYGSSGVLGSADALVKTGSGFLHCINVAQADAAPTAGTLTVLDNTAAGAGTQLWSWNLTTAVFIPFTVIVDVAFTIGLFLDITTTTDVNVFLSYR